MSSFGLVVTGENEDYDLKDEFSDDPIELLFGNMAVLSEYSQSFGRIKEKASQKVLWDANSDARESM